MSIPRDLPLSDEDLARVEDVLLRASGISLSKGLRRALNDSFARAARASGLSQAEMLARLARSDPESVATLVEHSVIGETYFFRHPEHFEALRRHLSCELAGEPELRVWSAGCASGEEPYSLAMALAASGRFPGRDRIVATDLSERALATARAGVYRGWSLRRREGEDYSRYFEPADGDARRVVSTVRGMVEFRQHNLIADPAPLSECHVVFCRNVLIYFTPETGSKVLHKLVGALRPGGLLAVGPVELPLATALELEWLDGRGGTLLRKPLPGARPAKEKARAEPPRTASPARPKPIQVTPERRPAPALVRPEAKKAPVPAPPAVLRASEPGLALFEKAREAAREGRLEEAESLALSSAQQELAPESYLLLSMTAELRGDLGAAVGAVRKALYLDPSLASGHAALVPLFKRLGREDEAERARLNALGSLEGLDDSVILRGVEIMTAGALRRALERSEERR